ncbi:MAG: hypothetical protein JOZ94_22285 [Xanthobacteraceae bacterium]|nr:hypothetical protein [Xanthobacteraceae bacterium]
MDVVSLIDDIDDAPQRIALSTMTPEFSLDDGLESSLRGAEATKQSSWALKLDCASGNLSGSLRFARNDGSAIDVVST